MKTYFVSGHLDLSLLEFARYYVPLLQKALDEGASFVVGDAQGTDTSAQRWLAQHKADVTVYHMLIAPRNNVGDHPTEGGFHCDGQRDSAMTDASDEDIAWVRAGRKNSGTAANLQRRAYRRTWLS